MAEVAVASPVVEADARIVGKSEPLRILGIDVFERGASNPELLATSVADSLDVLRAETVFLSPSAANWLAVKKKAMRFACRLGSMRSSCAWQVL